jgi:hypothetical protein
MLLKSTLQSTAVVSGGGGGGNVPIPIPLIFEGNDLSQTIASPSNVLQVFGDATQSAPPFTQKRSGLLTTTTLFPNQVTIENQRDVTSYVVGNPSVYNTQFATIQQAIDQAVLDGVDVNANPSRQVQILVKPGDYPDDALIPLHGISIFGLTNGQDREVRIQGTLTIAPTDNSGKTLINIRNLSFENGVNTTAINFFSPTAFNPKVMLENCFMFSKRIIMTGTNAAVELTVQNSLIDGIDMNNNSSVTLNYSTCQGTIVVSNNGILTGTIALNYSRTTTIQTNDDIESTVNLFATHSSFNTNTHQTNPMGITTPRICKIDATFCILLITCGSTGPTAGTISETHIKLRHCVGTAIFGLLADSAPLSRINIENCTFDVLEFRTKADISSEITEISIFNCSFFRDTTTPSQFQLVDSSTILVSPSPITAYASSCQYYSQCVITGINTQFTDIQGVHNITNVNRPLPTDALYIYRLESGSTLITFECTYTLKDITLDHVVFSNIASPVNWIRSYATSGGIAGSVQSNRITNLGSGPFNYVGGSNAGGVTFSSAGDVIL